VLMIGSVASLAIYHVSGRHAQEDFKALLAQLTAEHLQSFGVMLGKLVLLALGVAIAFRVLRRARIFLEVQVHHHLPKHVHPEGADAPRGEAPVANASGSSSGSSQDRRQHLEETIRRWFSLLEKFAMLMTLVAGLWLAGRVVGLTDVDGWARVVVRI